MTATTYVFLGPSLTGKDAQAELEGVYLPPVSQGDVYRAALERPRVIGIIDGYFERVPAVWHKEILWALSQGIRVYGSASMGALRAAELAPFGMEGVGKVFEAYRSGSLEDDDEVAVVHGPAEIGYRAGSEAMVNIRYTLAAAQAAGVVSDGTSVRLERIAKELFYPERSFELLLQIGMDQGVDEAEVTALRNWLPDGRVNQKRLDALAMLRTIKNRLETDPEPVRASFVPEHTVFWEKATAAAGVYATGAGQNSTAPNAVGLLAEELRIDGDAYARARQDAMARHLALREAERQDYVADDETVAAMEGKLRRKRGLAHPRDLDRWLEDNGVTRERFEELMREEALLSKVRLHSAEEALSRLPDHLLLSGERGRLLERARDKQRRLEEAGLQDATPRSIGLTVEALVTWYFTERLGRTAKDDKQGHPPSVELARDDTRAFVRAVTREFCYLRLLEHTRSGAPLPPEP